MASDASWGGAPWSNLAGPLLLVVVCMVLARTWAMLINRWADWRFDRENPRTSGRAIASGRLSPRAGLAVALACAAGFVGVCGLLRVLFANPWPLILSVPVLAWIAFYSFTKRFTWLCHVFLGGALAASPLAAAVAVEPGYLLSVPGRALWWLALMVMLWVAGFDVAYALQDLEFDRKTGLKSVPARLGVRGALWASRLLHALALFTLVAFSAMDPRLGVITQAAIVMVGGVLGFEHWVLHLRGVAGLPLAFFTLNGVVSVVLGSALVVDVALG